MKFNEERQSKQRLIELSVYTDGACKNSGIISEHHFEHTFGGWAYYIFFGTDLLKAGSGYEVDTSNQKMELTAAIEALKVAEQIRKPNEKVILYSDSAYLINCYHQKWWKNWVAKGWINSQKKPVANINLWQQLIPFFENIWYTFQKVKGHDGNFYNELCDEEASKMAQKAKEDWILYGRSIIPMQ